MSGFLSAPRLGLDRAGRLPDHVELAVGLDLADEHRLVQVVVLLVHLGQVMPRALKVWPAMAAMTLSVSVDLAFSTACFHM
jgi:hypothetical protein